MGVNVIVINERDNVGVATRQIKAGERIELGEKGGRITAKATADIPQAHKVALAEIEKGGRIVKYGETIGFAADAIHPGDYVHVHNLKAEES
jgi:altronate dehydratase